MDTVVYLDCPRTTMQGSVFVEFERKEDAEKFVSLDVVKFKDTELLRETKYETSSSAATHTVRVLPPLPSPPLPSPPLPSGNNTTRGSRMKREANQNRSRSEFEETIRHAYCNGYYPLPPFSTPLLSPHLSSSPLLPSSPPLLPSSPPPLGSPRLPSLPLRASSPGLRKLVRRSKARRKNCIVSSL